MTGSRNQCQVMRIVKCVLNFGRLSNLYYFNLLYLVTLSGRRVSYIKELLTFYGFYLAERTANRSNN